MKDYQDNKPGKDKRFLGLFRKTFNSDRIRNEFTIEEQAHCLGMALDTYDKKMKPSNENNDITVSEWNLLLELTGDFTTLEYFASKHGFGLNKLETLAVNKSIAEMGSQADKTMIEFGEAFKVAKDTLMDGVVTQKEKNKTLDEIDEAIKALEQLKSDFQNKEVEE